MEKIHLSKIDKQVLLHVSDNGTGCPRNISATTFFTMASFLLFP